MFLHITHNLNFLDAFETEETTPLYHTQFVYCIGSDLKIVAEVRPDSQKKNI